MATMVTALPPVSVVKKALAMMHTIARPPGIQPKNAFDARTMRSGVRDSAITYPMNVKSGTVTRMGEPAKRSSSTSGARKRTKCKSGFGWVSHASCVAPAITAKTGAPINAKTRTKAKISETLAKPPVASVNPMPSAARARFRVFVTPAPLPGGRHRRGDDRSHFLEKHRGRC